MRNHCAKYLEDLEVGTTSPLLGRNVHCVFKTYRHRTVAHTAHRCRHTRVCPCACPCSRPRQRAQPPLPRRHRRIGGIRFRASLHSLIRHRRHRPRSSHRCRRLRPSVPPWLGRPFSYASLQVFRGQLAVRRDPSGVHPPHQLAVVVRAQHAQRGEGGMLEDVDDERDQQEDG